MRRVSNWFLAAGLICAVGLPGLAAAESSDSPHSGCLYAYGAQGKSLGVCPLKHTDVRADISGLFARVHVTQHFANPYPDRIEAVYTFPLGAGAAVDDMSITVGSRVIRGKVRPREEARQVYEQARQAGRTAALLDQERPNIFTQSVANIEPGQEILVRIRYIEMLRAEDGIFRFVLPLVVAPRYMPGGAVSMGGTGREMDTTQVPDASRISPPVTPQGTRAGHDVSIRVTLDAGREIRSVSSRQHAIETRYLDPGRTRASVQLERRKEIPNRDFVLEYQTATDEITDALLTSADVRGGFFTLILQPPRRVEPRHIVPREYVFVLDTSGSMNGFPIEISKALMRRAIDEMRPSDSFNLITFAGSTHVLWEAPRANTAANRAEAQRFLEQLGGSGGTEMMTAIMAALAGRHDPDKVRLVAFLTDGEIGNDMAVIDAVRRNAGTTRVFSFGIGTSVNRYLLDNMALAGRGQAEYALNGGEAEPAAVRFYDRIKAPVLTDIRVDWGDLAQAVQAEEVYPRLAADLFSRQPVVLTGRYRPSDRDLTGTITLRGRTAEGAFERRVAVTLPARAAGGSALPSTWARAKVEHLMNTNLRAVQNRQYDQPVRDEITHLGVQFGLMTQYTSFVAVDMRGPARPGGAVTVPVPVEMPTGMSYAGTLGGSPAVVPTRVAAPYARPAVRTASDAPGTLPRPLFEGTPQNIREKNLRPPRQGPLVLPTLPTGCVNLAFKAPVSGSDASPIIGDYALVTDGDKEGTDGSYVELGPGPQFVQIDLKKLSEIHLIHFWHYHREGRVYRDVVVMVADDEAFTKNVRILFNNDYDNSLRLGAGKDSQYVDCFEGEVLDAKGVKARYVRLYSNGNTSNEQNHYTEVEVWGK